MTKSISQASQNNETISATTQTKTQQGIGSITPPTEYKPDSIWVNILYGLGMLAFIIIPPLIPGTSTRILIIGYISVVCGVYIAAAVMSAVRTIYPTKHYTRGRRR